MFRLKNKFLKKTIAVLMCALFILPIMPMAVSATTIEEVEAQQAALKQENAELENQIAALKDDEAKAKEYSEALQEKITFTENRIDTARETITNLNTNITDLETKLAEQQAYYNDTMAQLKKRIKALYQTGDVGTIEILLNSTSLYDFSLKSETLKSVAQHDKDLMDDIRNYMDKTQADREALKKQKDEVATLQKQLESDQEDLIANKAEYDAVVATLQSQQQTKVAKIAQNDEEDEALNAQLQDLIAQKKAEEEAARKKAEEEAAAGNNGGSGGESDGDTVYVPPTGGGSGGLSCLWPTPGYGTNYITQYYGGGHNGLDIGAPYGAAIVASESGQVLSASYHYSWGNNVLVYHNGTYSTRYAHMSSMAVSAGDYVEKGQIIGYIGSTGNSTGPHLHFEVYLDGYRVDPYPYL